MLEREKKLLLALAEGGRSSLLTVVVGDQSVEAVDHHLPICRHHFRNSDDNFSLFLLSSPIAPFPFFIPTRHCFSLSF